MAARYALANAVVHVTATGTDDWLWQGALRGSASAIVTQAPGLFTAVQLTAGTQIHPRLLGYLAQYPAGP